MIKYSPRTNLNVAIADGLLQMADRMHTKVFNSKIRETVKNQRGAEPANTTAYWDSKCSAVSDYKNFVKELIGIGKAIDFIPL